MTSRAARGSALQKGNLWPHSGMVIPQDCRPARIAPATSPRWPRSVARRLLKLVFLSIGKFKEQESGPRRRCSQSQYNDSDCDGIPILMACIRSRATKAVCLQGADSVFRSETGQCDPGPARGSVRPRPRARDALQPLGPIDSAISLRLLTDTRCPREFFHTVRDNRGQLHHSLTQVHILRNLALNAVAISL
jgi:hypothetical protein